MSFLILLLTQVAFAQVGPEVQPQFSNWDNQQIHLRPYKVPDNGLPNIVLIGYWPPTNEMVRKFNPKSADWAGENWEGRGFNIVSFFSEFSKKLPQGTGDFEVDYQDTSSDFWRLIPPLQPIAVLSFGRAHNNYDWEIEMVTRNLSNWRNDFVVPYRPETSPPDPEFVRDGNRASVFPGEAIVNAIRSHVPALNPFMDSSGAGEYLCEYLGFHLSWYRELNPQQVKFAAHTHIGSQSDLKDLKMALHIMLQTLTTKLEK